MSSVSARTPSGPDWRSGLAGLGGGVAHSLGDLLAHRQAGAKLRSGRGQSAAFALGQGFGHLKFDVIIQITDRSHAGAFVNGLLDFRRQGNIFDDKTGNLQPVFGGDGRVDDRQEGLTEFVVAGGHVEHGHLGQGDGLGEDADDARAHGIAKFIKAEMGVGAGDFLEK